MKVGDRVQTREARRLVMPEGFEAMAEVLAERPGTVVETKTWTIKVEGMQDIELPTVTVRLDEFPDDTLTFGRDELYPLYEDTPS